MNSNNIQPKDLAIRPSPPMSVSSAAKRARVSKPMIGKKITERDVVEGRKKLKALSFKSINDPIQALYNKHYPNINYGQKLQNSQSLLKTKFLNITQEKNSNIQTVKKLKNENKALKTSLQEGRQNFKKATRIRKTLLGLIFFTLPTVIIPIMLCFALLKHKKTYFEAKTNYREISNLKNTIRENNKKIRTLKKTLSSQEIDIETLSSQEIDIETLESDIDFIKKNIMDFKDNGLHIGLLDSVSLYLDKTYCAQQGGISQHICSDLARNTQLNGNTMREWVAKKLQNIPAFEECINSLPISDYIKTHDQTHMFINSKNMEHIASVFFEHLQDSTKELNFEKADFERLFKTPKKAKQLKSITVKKFTDDLKSFFANELQHQLFYSRKTPQIRLYQILKSMLNAPELDNNTLDNLIKSFSQIPTYIPYKTITGIAPDYSLKREHTLTHNIYYNNGEIYFSSAISPIILKNHCDKDNTCLLTNEEIKFTYILTPKGFQVESVALPDDKKTLNLIFAPTQLEKNRLMKQYLQEAQNS